ncbi:hypothetical protein [Flexivirga alba]|uniref:Uncharacterized protein n=1 Tax=Flexivirga alba TaxID=702742 RepID=A0ABW2AIY2_9MICO
MPRDEMLITLAGLVDALGAQLIRPLTNSATMTAPVSVPVIYDPADEIPDVPGGVLLLVGLHPDDESAALAIDDAGHHGFSAVVIKLRGQSPDRLLLRALEASCAVLAVDDAVPWRQLDRLITVVVGGGSGGESGDAGQELFVLADAIAAAVDGAVAIEDLDRNVLAYSNLERHKVDRMRRNGILARRVPDMDKNLRQYRDVMQAEG